MRIHLAVASRFRRYLVVPRNAHGFPAVTSTKREHSKRRREFETGAKEFLGTQGDPWDTQSDMFCALIGAIAALSLLTGIHDRQINA